MNEKAFSLGGSSLQKALALFLLSVLCAGQAFAYGFTVDKTIYVHYQDHKYPSYELAFRAMKPTYKADPYDTTPLIGMAETDLNGDKFPEIISFPTEELEQKGQYCKANDVCPHYILQVRGKKVKTLAIIPAVFVSQGDTVKNGFWTLRAYTKGTMDPDYFDLYAYDKNTDSYVLTTKTP